MRQKIVTSWVLENLTVKDRLIENRLKSFTKARMQSRRSVA